MNLNYYGTLKYVRTMADTVGLGVVFHEGETQPYTDGYSIHVERPNAGWPEEKWTVWFYTVLHEIGHERDNWNQWKKLMEQDKIAPKSFVGYLRNQFSDYGQERDQVGVYKGRDEYMSKGRKIWVEGGIDNSEPSVNDHRDAAIAVWVWDTERRERWMPDLIGMGMRGKRKLQGKQIVYLDRLEKSGLDADVIKSEDDVMPFTREVIKALGFDPEQEEEESRQMYEKMKAAGSGDGGEEDGGEEQMEGSFTVKYDDLLAHKHTKSSKESYGSIADLHIEYDKTKYTGSYVPGECAVYDFTTNTFPGRYASNVSEPSSYHQAKLRQLHVSHNLASKVKRILQILGQTRWKHSQKSGKLSSRTLYKGHKKINSPNVFKHKDQHFILDSAVTILTDFSGSMGSTKSIHAMRATTMLNDAIGKLNVPLEVLGFTEDDYNPVHFIFKKFNDKVSTDVLEDRMLKACNIMDCNADGESIQWAYERLAKQKEKRKILIVLSDGSPSANRSGDVTWHTSQVIKNIENNSPVEIYGIGIMDENVKHFYKEHATISQADQLEEAVLKVIRTKIIGD